MAVPTTTSRTPATANTNGSTRVALVGTGYTGTTGVTVAGAAATDVHVVDDTHLNFLTPAHAAVSGAAIVVTNATGPSTTNVTIDIAAAATETYTQPDGDAEGNTYFMDVEINPASVADGSLVARFDTVRYPKAGITAARTGESAPAPLVGV